MLPLLFIFTGGLLGYLLFRSWKQSRDPLHPAIFLAPLFAYSYAVEPLLLGDALTQAFSDPDRLPTVAVYFLLCIVALTVGLLRMPHIDLQKVRSLEVPRKQLFTVAVGLAVVAVVGYAWGLANVGGFVEAYSRAKGGGRSGSGYIGEAMNLGLVAALFVGFARQNQGLARADWLLLLFAISPNLLQGTFGGRRGPLFLALGATLLSYTLAHRSAIKLSHLVSGVVVICVCVLFVASQRQHLHLGSDDASLDWEKFSAAATIDKVNQGNNYIYGAGHILTAIDAGRYTWGKKILVTLLVRPIPKQIWPSKYEDVGAFWVTDEAPGYSNYTPSEWKQSTGWIPFAGSSSGSASDLFSEFSWAAIFVFYLIGRGLSAIYWRHRKIGQVWTLLHLEALVLSIYLATQSFSAFYHRFLILAIPTILIFRYLQKQSLTAGRKLEHYPQV